MKVSVTKDRVNIIKDDEIHAGEYNINKCEFEFSEEYTEDLVKIAVFKKDTDIVKMLIKKDEDNICKCGIPVKILKKSGTVILGVYAYDLKEDNQLELRYSPSPTDFFVAQGSYNSDYQDFDEVDSSLVEQALQNMNDTLNLANEKITTVSELIKELTSTSESLEEAQEIAKQLKEQLENGDFRGEPGKDGVDGKNGTDGKSTYQIWLDEGNTGSEQDFLDSLKGIDGIQGPQGEIGPQGLPGEKGADGYTPRKGTDYYTEADKQEMKDYCKDYIDDNYLSLLEEEY